MWAAEVVALCLCSLLRCFEEGRGAVIFVVAFHSGAVVVRSRGVGVASRGVGCSSASLSLRLLNWSPEQCDAAGCSVGDALCVAWNCVVRGERVIRVAVGVVLLHTGIKCRRV